MTTAQDRAKCHVIMEFFGQMEPQKYWYGSKLIEEALKAEREKTIDECAKIKVDGCSCNSDRNHNPYCYSSAIENYTKEILKLKEPKQ